MADETKHFQEKLVAPILENILRKETFFSYSQLCDRVIAILREQEVTVADEDREKIDQTIRQLAPLGATDLDNRLYHAARERPWYTAVVIFILLGVVGAVLEYFVQSGLDGLLATRQTPTPTLVGQTGHAGQVGQPGQTSLASQAGQNHTLRPLAVPLPKSSVTVFPFVNVTKAPAEDWLSIGLADSIEAKLSAVKKLHVVTRPKTKKAEDPKLVAQQKGIAVGVSGSFQVVGQQIRISAKVISLQKGLVILATHEEKGTLSQIFDLQDKIAIATAKTLGHKFSTADKNKLAAEGTRNFEAFKLFASGKKLLEEGRTLEAINQLAKAASYDPTYKAASKELSFVKASAHHVRIKADGSIVYLSMNDITSWEGGNHYKLNSSVGRTISARDVSGRRLNFTCNEIKKTNLPFVVWRTIFTYDVAPKKGERVRILLEVDVKNKVIPIDELRYMKMGFSTSARVQKLFIIELPPKAKMAFMVPLPEAVINQDDRSYYLFHQFSEESVLTNWTVVYSFDSEAIDQFTRLQQKEQRTMLRRGSKEVGRPIVEQILPFQLSEAIRLDATKEAKELISRIESSKGLFSTFFALWGRGCLAAAKNKRGPALAFFEAAAETKYRPHHLVDDLFRKLIEIHREKGSAKKTLRLLDKELKRRYWWSHRTFHKLPSKLDTALLEKLHNKDCPLAVKYDLALQYRRLEKNDEAWAIIEPLLYRQHNPYVIRLAASIALARNDNSQAFALMEKLTDKLPLDSAYIHHLTLLTQAKRIGAALALFTKEIGHKYARPWFVDSLVEHVLLHIKNPAEHESAIKKAMAGFLDTKSPRTNPTRALLLLSELLKTEEPRRRAFSELIIDLLKELIVALPDGAVANSSNELSKQQQTRDIQRIIKGLLQVETLGEKEKSWLKELKSKFASQNSLPSTSATTTQ